MTHPLKYFNYCPKCGSKQFMVNNEKSKKCDNCSFIYYFNSSAAVVAVIKNTKGELLVARRSVNPMRGSLDLPGGFVDLFETAEEAVKREVKEETRLDVSNCRYLFSIPNIYEYSNFEVHTVDMFFYCDVENFNFIKAQDDISELLFMEINKIDPNDFGLLSIQMGINKLKAIMDVNNGSKS